MTHILLRIKNALHILYDGFVSLHLTKLMELIAQFFSNYGDDTFYGLVWIVSPASDMGMFCIRSMYLSLFGTISWARVYALKTCVTWFENL